ncbi:MULTISPECIES: metallophosphoesterase [Streptococcus]|uniref:Serine/threonine protein phosphatase 1 n=2 Tax=Streptococcus TaxID=1301 RepID=A0ABS2PUX5_9STRE|nr:MULTISPECIES: metallophosphoesterase [Streptococcus]MBM7635913.1 serine/threonine protein phosphatase 1 [Streptococcus saliviloxodontae]MBM7643249.1 serine/threonine protein phosphatase 1 [Streptococcus loxodontisalivarius]
MAIYYAISDIHGYLDEFLTAFEKVDLTNSENRLFLLGDYVDNGNYSYQVLETIRELESKYPNQVKTLLGNHDEWFYHWLITEDISPECSPETIKSFFSLDELTLLLQRNPNQFEKTIRDEIKSNPKFTPLIDWFKCKFQDQRYIETDWQIFVHAGVDEEAGIFWKEGTDPKMFTNKFPVTTGKFFKDIISGHVGSSQIAHNEEYLGKIFFDKYNHYFIDGTVDRSKVIPVLEFDTTTQTYNY